MTDTRPGPGDPPIETVDTARHQADRLSLALLAAVLVGLAALLASNPIDGRGDYGQWLMAARFYLGEEVPDYRNLAALPPVIPIGISLLTWLLRDAVLALQLFTVILGVGLAAGFFLVANALFRRPAAGLLAVVLGMLVTDRFLELFAFGGLLQAGAITFLLLSVTAFTLAGRGPRVETRWWVLGSLSLGLAALSHVGTGVIVVPAGLGAAAVSLLRLRRVPPKELARAAVPLGVTLAIVAVYWLVVLLPVNGDYTTNPASLGYRGPERLLSLLSSGWQTPLIIASGAATVGLGLLGEVARRTVGRHVVLFAWTAAAWGLLAASIVTGAATDYPRFATPLLAPLAIGAAGGLLWMFDALISHLHALVPRASRTGWSAVALATVVAATGPLAAGRYGQHVTEYAPRDAGALTTIATVVDARLGDSQSVLTLVREGKWIEGLGGHAALFSLPVRYAFRSVEWARALDAATLLLSRGAIANEFFFLKFADGDPCSIGDASGAFTLAINHEGEYLDAIGLEASHVRVSAGDEVRTLASFSPTDSTSTVDEDIVSLQSRWQATVGAVPVTYVQSLAIRREASTIELTAELHAAGGDVGLELDLLPTGSRASGSVLVTGRSAEISLPRVGRQEPRLQVAVAGNTGTLEMLPGGGLRIRSDQKWVRILVTDLTASDRYSSSLRLLCTREIRDRYDVGAAVLPIDAAFETRAQRLGALDFRLAEEAGPYALLVRDDAVRPSQP